MRLNTSETCSSTGSVYSVTPRTSSRGPFTTLASFFRAVLSRHGRGHALVLMQSPQDANSSAERANVCLHDNEALARYLVTNFVANFGAFKGELGLQSLSYRMLDSVQSSGDPASIYSETVNGLVLPGKPVPREIAGANSSGGHAAAA
jgi:hypothetical protein